MIYLVAYVLLIVIFIDNPSFAKTTLPSIERVHRSIDSKTNSSEGSIDFKNAVTVISGKGVVRSKDGATMSNPNPHPMILFWSTQMALAQQLKSLSATSKEAALKNLRDALYSHYLDSRNPLIAFVHDLDNEGLWLYAHAGQSENASLIETWEALVTTVNNLLLW